MLDAGDCRAVLCKGGRAIQLNREHSAEILEERQRVEEAGGKLREVMGSWRIGDAGLQVTRYVLLGNFISFSSCGKHLGVEERNMAGWRGTRAGGLQN
jgi:hypothetical protein